MVDYETLGKLTEAVGQIPGLNVAHKLTGEIYNVAQSAKRNKRNIQDLAHRITELMLEVAKVMTGRWDGATDKMKESLDKLEHVLREILTKMQKISRDSWFKHLFNASKNERIIQKLEATFEKAVGNMTFTMSLQTMMAVQELPDKLRELTLQAQVQAQESQKQQHPQNEKAVVEQLHDPLHGGQPSENPDEVAHHEFKSDMPLQHTPLNKPHDSSADLHVPEAMGQVVDVVEHIVVPDEDSRGGDDSELPRSAANTPAQSDDGIDGILANNVTDYITQLGSEQQDGSQSQKDAKIEGETRLGSPQNDDPSTHVGHEESRLTVFTSPNATADHSLQVNSDRQSEMKKDTEIEGEKDVEAQKDSDTSTIGVGHEEGGEFGFRLRIDQEVGIGQSESTAGTEIKRKTQDSPQQNEEIDMPDKEDEAGLAVCTTIPDQDNLVCHDVKSEDHLPRSLPDKPQSSNTGFFALKAMGQVVNAVTNMFVTDQDSRGGEISELSHDEDNSPVQRDDGEEEPLADATLGHSLHHSSEQRDTAREDDDEVEVDPLQIKDMYIPVGRDGDREDQAVLAVGTANRQPSNVTSPDFRSGFQLLDNLLDGPRNSNAGLSAVKAIGQAFNAVTRLVADEYPLGRDDSELSRNVESGSVQCDDAAEDTPADVETVYRSQHSSEQRDIEFENTNTSTNIVHDEDREDEGDQDNVTVPNFRSGIQLLDNLLDMSQNSNAGLSAVKTIGQVFNAVTSMVISDEVHPGNDDSELSYGRDDSLLQRDYGAEEISTDPVASQIAQGGGDRRDTKSEGEQDVDPEQNNNTSTDISPDDDNNGKVGFMDGRSWRGEISKGIAKQVVMGHSDSDDIQNHSRQGSSDQNEFSERQINEDLDGERVGREEDGGLSVPGRWIGSLQDEPHTAGRKQSRTDGKRHRDNPHMDYEDKHSGGSNGHDNGHTSKGSGKRGRGRGRGRGRRRGRGQR